MFADKDVTRNTRSSFSISSSLSAEDGQYLKLHQKWMYAFLQKPFSLLPSQGQASKSLVR
jgi:hypothetical protein